MAFVGGIIIGMLLGVFLTALVTSSKQAEQRLQRGNDHDK